mmetsp:Transcript_34815/g.97683  ORF Transcript_34815/g.97683 Transcript_34815/m.97683 type:complete len:175 (+) Transcript_34815:84-608(+)
MVGQSIIESFERHGLCDEGLIDRSRVALVAKLLDPSWDEANIELMLDAFSGPGKSHINCKTFVDWIYDDSPVGQQGAEGSHAAAHCVGKWSFSAEGLFEDADNVRVEFYDEGGRIRARLLHSNLQRMELSCRVAGSRVEFDEYKGEMDAGGTVISGRTWASADAVFKEWKLTKL